MPAEVHPVAAASLVAVTSSFMFCGANGAVLARANWAEWVPDTKAFVSETPDMMAGLKTSSPPATGRSSGAEASISQQPFLLQLEATTKVRSLRPKSPDKTLRKSRPVQMPS